MIIVDTNIISEAIRTVPDPGVIDWLNEQYPASLFLSAITLAELSYGLHAMPPGKRRSLLEQKLATAIRASFNHSILEFDQKAAGIYGELMARQNKIGHPMTVLDGQIAAIARSHGFDLATRNEKDFVNCGIKLINPFKN